MWRVTVYLVTIWLLVQVNASPETSLENLLDRLVTLEDWKRETETEVAQQGAIIQNLERNLAIQVNPTTSPKPCKEDELEDAEVVMEEDLYGIVREGQAPANRIRVTDLHKQIPSNGNTQDIQGAVAFTVYLDHNLDLGPKQTIKFNQIFTNEGNGYDSVTGIFSCPTAGIYLFSFFVGERSDSGGSGIWAGLIVNTKLMVDAVVDAFHTFQDLQGGNMVVLRLNQEDDVWIDSTGSYHVEGDTTLRLTTFTGVLLSAD